MILLLQFIGILCALLLSPLINVNWSGFVGVLLIMKFMIICKGANGGFQISI